MRLAAHTPQPWPKGTYKRYRAKSGCVQNATMLAWDHLDELTLAKGYALQDDEHVRAWVGHWWCIDREGRVVDPTWKNEGRAYVALEIVDSVEHAKRVSASGSFELGLAHTAPPELVVELEICAFRASLSAGRRAPR